ncbi:MAG: hypothetical protein M1816_001708 [Peltula sp. TS41687]|nr:MAG: hypothetical protein M1816_001708 [Peltula sp. TS41687]
MTDSGSTTEDEDVKRAIALSLADHDQPATVSQSPSTRQADGTDKRRKAERQTVDLTNDSDESDSYIPVSHIVSLLGKEALARTPEVEQSSVTRAGPVDGKANPPSSLLSLDRKKMEEERLARLKRKASISPPRLKREKRPQKDTDLSFQRDASRVSSDILAGRDTIATSSRNSDGILPMPSDRPLEAVDRPSDTGGQLQYPHGTIKKTWAFGYARADDIKIEEVLQKNTLTTAVLSSFQWDVEWLLRKLDLTKTKLVLAMQAKDEATKAQYRAETASMASLCLCFPSMAGNVNCMHSKLQLLFHPTHLRVVVPSANLIPYDWGEMGGIMENIVFLVDLPRLKTVDQSDKETRENLTLFGKELIYFLEAMGLDQDIIKGVLKFDFAGTDGIAFVHTIGGSHAGESWRRTGYCGLGAAVKALGLQHEGTLDIDFVTSSIGSLNDAFLRTIYLAAQGDDGLTEYTWRTTRTSSSRKKGTSSTDVQPTGEAELTAVINNRFRIYFPTKDTVMSSKGGTRCGGTICLQPRWYRAPTFPRSLFRDCKSQRPGMLMHNKVCHCIRLKKYGLRLLLQIIFARPQLDGSAPNRLNDKPLIPWVYVGSANLSESAWGRLVHDKTTKQPKLNCRNWECGVVVPMPPSSPGGRSTHTPATATEMDVFTGHVPVPMQHPGAPYESKTPWFNSEPDA